MAKILNNLQLSVALSYGVFIGDALAVSPVVPDGTTNTLIEQFGSTYAIRGDSYNNKNLFHSFSDLSISSGDLVHFVAENSGGNALSIDNIIARVTGENPTQINGTLRSDTSLWLLNHNGIVAGQGAAFDVNGGLYLSSADKLNLQGGAEFSVEATAVNTDLLSFDPVGFGFLNTNPFIGAEESGGQASISIDLLDSQAPNNAGKLMIGANTDYIALVGSDIDFKNTRLINESGLEVPKIDIFSIGQAHNANFIGELKNAYRPALDELSWYETSSSHGAAPYSVGAKLEIDNLYVPYDRISLGLSEVFLFGNTIDISNSFFSFYDFALLEAQAQNIDVTNSDFIRGNDFVATALRFYAQNDLTLNGFNFDPSFQETPLDTFLWADNRLSISNSALDWTQEYPLDSGFKQPFNVHLAGKNDLSISNSTVSIGSPYIVGNLGDIYAGSLNLVSEGAVNILNSTIIASTITNSSTDDLLSNPLSYPTRFAPVGSIFVTAESLSVTSSEGAGGRNSFFGIEAHHAQNAGGIIDLDVKQGLELRGNNRDKTGIFQNVGEGTGAEGFDSGRIDLQASTIELSSGASISSLTLGSRNAGATNILANALHVNDASIVSDTRATGNAGDITIELFEQTDAGKDYSSAIAVLNDATLSSSSIQSISSASSIDASGAAGSIAVESGALLVDDSTISVSTNASDSANSRASVFLSAHKADVQNIFSPDPEAKVSGIVAQDLIIQSATQGATAAGDVSLKSSDQVMLLSSTIETSTAATGDAGAVLIQANNVMIAGSSEASAESISSQTSSDGDAGSIIIQAGSNLLDQDPSNNDFGSGLILLSQEAEISSKAASSNSAGVGGTAGSISFEAGAIKVEKASVIASADSNSNATVGNQNTGYLEGRNKVDITLTAYAQGDTNNPWASGDQSKTITGIDAAGLTLTSDTQGATQAGDISLRANVIKLADTRVSSNGGGPEDGGAGKIRIKGIANDKAETIEITNNSTISAVNQGTFYPDRRGYVGVESNSLLIDGSTISTDLDNAFVSYNYVAAGAVELKSDDIEIKNGSLISSSADVAAPPDFDVLFASGDVSISSNSANSSLYIDDSTVSVLTKSNNSVPGKIISNIVDVHLNNGAKLLASIEGNGSQGNASGAIGGIELKSTSPDSKVHITNGSSIETDINAGTNAPADISITANDILIQNNLEGLEQARVTALAKSGALSKDGFTGNIELNGNIQILDDGLVSIEAQRGSNTLPGSIRINENNNTGSLLLGREGSNFTKGEINASNRGGMNSFVGEKAPQGAITIAGKFTEISGGVIAADADGDGLFAAKIELDSSDYVDIVNDSLISTSARNGAKAGQVSIESNRVYLAGSVVLTTISSDLKIDSADRAAITLTSNVEDLVMDSGARINAATSGDADAGGIVLASNGLVQVLDDTELSSTSSAGGSAGQVEVTGAGVIIDNALINVTTTSANSDNIAAGITIDANGGAFSLTNARNSSITTPNKGLLASTSGAASAGSISISNASNIVLSDATIDSKSSGTGAAGSVTLNATGNKGISLTRSDISTSTTSDIDSIASIELNAANGDLVLENSFVQGSSYGDTDAGNINLFGLSYLQSGGEVSTSSGGDLNNDGRIDVNEVGAGNAGIINIARNDNNDSLSGISIDDGGDIRALSEGAGAAGGIRFSNHGDFKLNGLQNNKVEISVSANNISSGTAGNLALSGQTLTLNHARVSATTVSNQTQQSAQAASISFSALEKLIINNSDVAASTSGAVDAGNILLSASAPLELANASISSTSSGVDSGQAGQVNLNANGIYVSDSVITTSTQSNNLSNERASILLDSGGQNVWFTNSNILADTSGSSAAGTVAVKGNSVLIRGANSLISSGTSASGNAGEVSVVANDLLIANAKGLLSTSVAAEGDAGDISLDVINQVELVNATIDSSSIDSSSTGLGETGKAKGAAGNIRVNATNIVMDGSGIETLTESDRPDANAASLFITTSNNGRIELRNSSKLSTDTEGASIAGDIQLSTGSVSLESGSRISSSASASGDAGSISLSVKDSIDVNLSQITTQAALSGGGGVSLDAESKIVIDSAIVTASALGQRITPSINSSVLNLTGVDAGSVRLTAPLIIAKNSQIIANANEGNGGEVNVSADTFLTDANTRVSASSNAGLDGQVVVDVINSQDNIQTNQPEVQYININDMLNRACYVESLEDNSSFVIAPEKSEILSPGDYILSDVSRAYESPENSSVSYISGFSCVAI